MHLLVFQKTFVECSQCVSAGRKWNEILSLTSLLGRQHDVMKEQIMDLEINLLNPDSLVSYYVIFEPCRP